VTITTAGSSFRNMLAVYTGLTVSNLTIVATNLAGVGTNTSQVTFNAIAGTDYKIAVDGFGAASGNVTVNVAVTGVVVLTNPLRQPDGLFHFTVVGPAGQVLRIEATTNLTGWATIATITNVTGTFEFTDTASLNFRHRFYRAVDANAPIAVYFSSPIRLPNGDFAFTINSPAGQVMQIVAGTNLSTWSPLAVITNISGTDQFIDSSATNLVKRFYRAITP
jgi:hypothetical protein